MIQNDLTYKLALDSLKKGQALDALEFFYQVAQKFPKAPEPYTFIARILNAQGEHGGALEMAKQAINVFPKFVPAYHEKAKSLKGLSLNEEAGKALEKGLQIAPDDQFLLTNMIMYLEQQKKFDKIEPYFKRLKSIAPEATVTKYAEGLWLARTDRYAEAITVLEAIDNAPSIEGVSSAYLLAEAYDKLKKFDESMAALSKAKQTQKTLPETRLYNSQRYLSLLKHILRYDGTLQPLAQNAESQKISFIVGFPRSGTTLTGQILQSHPSITVTDEVQAMGQLIMSLIAAGKTMPATLYDLTPEEVTAAREIYWLHQKNDPRFEEADLFVDKMPLNYIYMPLIQILFPASKIIFCERHPLDTILSGYMQSFALNDSMACFLDLADAVEMYCLSMDCWEKHKKNLSLPVHQFKYEDLVQDFEGEVRKLLDFLGEDWDDEILRFSEKAKENVRTRTPSHRQITKGIYKTSAFKWKNYSQYLEPYFERINPYVVKLGYDSLL
ncbi:MAG: hypothetical protein GC136_07270 [Alphaproteobacteria bacterium]|nr:hypothetical protein [Alphaproteobacteria bacterium]